MSRDLRRPLTLLSTLAVAAALAGPLAAAARASCERPFDDPDDVLTFTLKMSRADWDRLRTEKPLAPMMPCEPQFTTFEAQFRCGEAEPFIKVGVRQKFGQDRDQDKDTTQKPPIKIDFNEHVMGQRWPAAMGELGYRKLTLNNGQTNLRGGILPSLLSEHMGLRLLKREIPTTPGAAFAKLFVEFENGQREYHGLYLLVEDVDRGAIRRRFGTAGDAGRLLKTTRTACRDEVVYDDGDPNEAKALWEAFAARNPSAAGATWPAEAGKAMHLDDLLRQEALRDIMAHEDDSVTSSNMNNYLAFDPRVGKRWFIPWDVDGSFQGNTYEWGFGAAPGNPYTTPIAPSCSGLATAGIVNTVGQLTRCHPSLEKAYLQAMCALTNGTMNEAKIVAEWDAVDKIIRPIVAMEKDLVWGGRDPLGNNPAGRGTYATEFTRLRAWITARIPEVRRQIAAKGVACAAGCTDGAKESCEALACPGTRTCRAGLWSVCEAAPGCAAASPRADGGAANGGGRADGGAPGRADAGVNGRPAMGEDGGAPTADAAAASGRDAARAPGGGGRGGSTGTGGGGAGGGEEPSEPTRERGKGGGGCALAPAGAAGGWAIPLLLLGAIAGLVRRRRA